MIQCPIQKDRTFLVKKNLLSIVIQICYNDLWPYYYKRQTFSLKNFDFSVLSIWIGYQINGIIFNVQLSNFLLFLVLASGELLEALGSGIGAQFFAIHFSFRTLWASRILVRNVFISLEHTKVLELSRLCCTYKT